ncbi:MmcQ/YjbR family DNA-binding protein [Ruminococcaceae bacterium OttesenSCG-928-L11]|nr:MmcQ/YjbR family DNA-binding protein [Ruminococcaceae bacterium OttesenSCG-928-L11]
MSGQTKQDIIDLCLTFPGAWEDYPFDENWACIRHQAGRKTFAWIYHRNGKLWINLKCDPMTADFYRSVYQSVTPGYHMNKEHWNTVELGGDVPANALEEMIGKSHALTAAPARKRPRQQMGEGG